MRHYYPPHIPAAPGYSRRARVGSDYTAVKSLQACKHSICCITGNFYVSIKMESSYPHSLNESCWEKG